MLIFLLWVLLSIAVGAYASGKKVKMGGFGGFFVSIIFSPIVGFLAVALTKPDERNVIDSGQMKKCPQCAELIKREALVCRFCGNKFKDEKPVVQAKPIVENHPRQTEDKAPKHLFVYLAIGFVLLVIICLILKHFYPN